MTSAYILILAILILGGLIAALGDRIGTKVGKARLRLFHLRPKQTAIVFTIVTGIVISASTLGILFALSKSLRQGVFQLDEILQKRRHVQADLLEVTAEKERVEQELKQVEIQEEQVKERLLSTEIELKETQIRLQNFSKRTEELKKEVTKLLREKENLITERKKIEQKTKELQTQIQQKDQELNLKQAEIKTKEEILQQQEQSLATLAKKQLSLETEIKARDQQISELDRSISLRDKTLQEKEILLSRLESKLDFLQKEVEVLEQYYQTYQDLRERPIAVVKGQVLTITLVNIAPEVNLDELIDGILSEANRAVMIILGYGNQVQPRRFIQITKGQVQQIKEQLSQKGQYLIRILSAGNYVQGEENIRVFADVAPNEKIYSANETIAGITFEKEDLSPRKIQEKLDFLIAIAQFRARKQGVLGQIFIGDGKVSSLLNFIQELQESNTKIDEIKAVSTNVTYTSGPLNISLIVIADGEEIIKL
jgi:uncharacterized protein (DUF3084 family)